MSPLFLILLAAQPYTGAGDAEPPPPRSRARGTAPEPSNRRGRDAELGAARMVTPPSPPQIPPFLPGPPPPGPPLLPPYPLDKAPTPPPGSHHPSRPAHQLQRRLAVAADDDDEEDDDKDDDDIGGDDDSKFSDIHASVSFDDDDEEDDDDKDDDDVAFKRTTKQMINGLGEVRLVCERDSSESLKLYVEVDANAWENLPVVSSGFEVSIMAPSGCDPFKHAFLTFGAGGHPPWDGRQFNGERPGGYGVPHLDVHFFVVTPAEREALTGTCKVFDPGPADSTGQLIQCDETAPETSAFVNLPPAEYITGFSHDGAFGGHSIRRHGLHLLPDDDLAPGGPAHCVSTGPSSGGPAGWLDCQEQFLGSVTPNPTEGSFFDKNCTCGYWADQISAIVNVYDGQVLGNEAMPTIALAGLLRDGELPNPFYKPYPQAERYQTAGYRPVNVMAALDPLTDTFMTGLALHPEYMEAN